MTPLFQKLNLKAQTAIVVLDAPPEFEPALIALSTASPVVVHRAPTPGVDFAIAFAVTQAQLDSVSAGLVKTDLPDPVLWVAYPKGTSKRYRCEFNRDTGFTVLGAAGFEPVRQVALDADWSALRFRRVERIASFTRRASMTISSDGQRRATRCRPTTAGAAGRPPAPSRRPPARGGRAGVCPAARRRPGVRCRRG